MKTAWKVLVGIFAAFGALVLVGIILNRTLPNTPSKTATVPTLGPAQTLCVSHLSVKGFTRTCGTVHVGMTQREVESELGAVDGPGMVSTMTVASGTIEHWRYLGSINHDQQPTLEFDNGILTAVSYGR